MEKIEIWYIVVAIVFVTLEGLFPYHWHGFVNKSEKNKKTYKQIIKELTPLFVLREYFMSISLSIVGWVAGYYLLFKPEVFNDNAALIIAAFVVFVLGATGYLPYFFVNKLGSLK